MFTYYSGNSRALTNYTDFLLPVLCKWNNKPWMTVRVLTTEYFKPIVRSNPQKKDFFQNMLIDYACSHSRALMEMYYEISVFMLAITASVLQPIHQEPVLTSPELLFKKKHFIISFDSDCSVDLGEVNSELSGQD